MPTDRRWNAPQLFAMMFGASLAAGGFLHFWKHTLALAVPLGPHDWAPVVIIVLGAGIAFNEQVRGLIRDWRGRREK